MSHSSGIGNNVQEETDGTGTPDSPVASNWTAANGSASQVQKCQDGVAYLEQDKQEGVREAHTHPFHSMDPTCRQIHTNSVPHTNTHACDDCPKHTDEHTPHSQPVTKDSPYMETANTPHTQSSDGWGGVEEKEVRKQNDGRDAEEVENTEEEKQQAEEFTVQVRIEQNVSAECNPIQQILTNPITYQSSKVYLLRSKENTSEIRGYLLAL